MSVTATANTYLAWKARNQQQEMKGKLGHETAHTKRDRGKLLSRKVKSI